MTGDPITDGGDGGSSPNSIQFTYDLNDDELPSHAVVRAVAAITNESSLDLEPLHDAIDPGHLNDVFERTDDGTISAELSFAFHDFAVTVTDEEVRVREADDAD
jgi:hypothetical protein